MAVLGAIFLVIALAVPGQLGMGDVKLAGLLGLSLAWFGFSTLLLGMLLAWGAAAVFVAVKRLLSRQRGTLALAPFLFLGTLVAILMA
jgi:leader peptidase (prepilin peptidase)/N-methyltransferase